MNLKKYHQLICGLALLLLSACTKPLEIELPEHDPKLVVNSLSVPINTDSALENIVPIPVINLSRSFSTLAGTKDSLGNDSAFMASVMTGHALVTISFAGRTVEMTNLDHSGFYAGFGIDYLPGQQYTLHVKDSTSGMECSSTTRMYPVIHFDEVKPVVDRSKNDTPIVLNYTLQDKSPAEDNYYLITYFTQNGSSAGSTKIGGFSMKKKNNDFVILSDQVFTDGRYTGKLPLSAAKAKDSVVVMLSSISPEYYQFLATFQRSGSLFNQLTGEPINFPSNIEKGFGFFNLHNPSVRVFDLSKF